MQYEINYLVLQSKTADLDRIRQEIKQLIQSFGATITGEKNYLKRKLAYEIKHEGYGFYTVLRYDLEDAQKVADIKRALNLNNSIARYIVVKADELPALPTDLAPTQEAAPAAEVEKTTKAPVKEELSPKETPVQETKPAQKAEVVTEEPKEKEAAPAETVQEKEPAAKEEKPTEKKEEKDKDDKASLDELDKKLDEILNS